MTIGEVAGRTGFRTSALRYYETTGLLEPAVDRLTVIRFCRQLDFTLDEIRMLLTEPRGRRQKARWRELVDVKVVELDETLARVRAMKKVLLVSRDCDCVDVQECAAACS